MDKNNNDQIEIIELFMAQADRDRRFFGTIKRGQDSDGTPVVYGKIKVRDGFVCASAATQEELGKRLDEMVLMILDYGLYGMPRRTVTMSDTDCFLN